MIALTCGMAINCGKPGCPRCDLDLVPPPLEDTDPAFAALVAATPYIDAGWRLVPGGPLKPSQRISLVYLMSATNHYIGIARAQREAAAWLLALLDEARERYRAGFYANPLGDPVARPVPASEGAA